MKKIKGSSDGFDLWEHHPHGIEYEVAFKMKGIVKIIRIKFDGIDGYEKAKVIAKALKVSKLVQGVKVFGIKWFYRVETDDVAI